MAFGLDSTGFTIKRLPDILASLKAKAIEVFGANVTTDPDSVFGQLFATFADELATVWEGMQGTYDAFRPDAAEGVNLDEVCDLNAIVRLPATATEVNALLTGTPSTVIPAGSLASVLPTQIQFELQTAVTLDATSVFSIAAHVSGGAGTYTLTINGTPFTFTATVETAAQIVAALKVAVDGGTEPVIFTDNTDGSFVLSSNDSTTEFAFAHT